MSSALMPAAVVFKHEIAPDGNRSSEKNVYPSLSLPCLALLASFALFSLLACSELAGLVEVSEASRSISI